VLSASELKLYDDLKDKRDPLVVVEELLKEFFIIDINDIISTPKIYEICKIKDIVDYGIIKDTLKHLISLGILILCPREDITDMRERWYAITSIGLSEW